LKDGTTGVYPRGMKTCFFILLLAGTLFGAEVLPLGHFIYEQDSGLVPQGASVSLDIPAKVVIGHQMPAKLVVRNEGTVAFDVSTGGDYRATGFPQRMKVRVRDASGKALPELTFANYGVGGGGLSSVENLQPGRSHGIDFPLDRYVSFPSAGEYTVIAGHDLGWKWDKNRPHPLASARVQVVLPTAQEALALVKAIVARKQTTLTHIAFQGKSYPPMRDEAMDYITQAKLCVLRHPVFLPALIEAAKDGSAEAVSGIGYIPIPDATEALISLLKSDGQRITSEALTQLSRRVPSRGDPAKPALMSLWGDVFQIGPLLPGAWKSDFEAPLAEAATQLLGHANPNVVSAAATIISCCVHQAAAPAVLAALQKSLDARREIPRDDTAALYPPLPEPALLGALVSLRKRGWRSPGSGNTATLVARFLEYADKDIPKPADDEWKDDMLTWVEHGPVTLKEISLRAIPLPLSPAAVEAVIKALDDEDPRVLIAACEVAEASKLADFVKPLCQLIEMDRVERVHEAAIKAAEACHGGMVLLHAVAQTIIVKDHLVSSVKTLVRGTIELPPITSSGGSSNFTTDQRFHIRAAWRDFLAKHESELVEGRKMPMPDVETLKKLTGADNTKDSSVVDYSFKDGSRWPPTKR
jgi:hypothetical protein